MDPKDYSQSLLVTELDSTDSQILFDCQSPLPELEFYEQMNKSIFMNNDIRSIIHILLWKNGQTFIKSVFVANSVPVEVIWRTVQTLEVKETADRKTANRILYL